MYWRKLSDINIEHELPISDLTDGNSRRWAAGTHKIILQGHLPNDPLALRGQIFTYHIDTDTREQLTDNPKGVLGGMTWQAPRVQKKEYVSFTMEKEHRKVLVYRKIPGADRCYAGQSSRRSAGSGSGDSQGSNAYRQPAGTSTR